MKNVLKIENVEFNLIVHAEHTSVKGNAIDSGDHNYDESVERDILDRLNDGDIWAWCTVEVKAIYKNLQASDYLGCCSYKSEIDFKEDGYYEDMKVTAFNELKKQVEDIVNAHCEEGE